jgi:hypothetical protein
MYPFKFNILDVFYLIYQNITTKTSSFVVTAGCLRHDIHGSRFKVSPITLELNTQKIKGLSIISIDIEPDHDDIDLLTITGKMDFRHAPIQISIDRWGITFRHAID